MEDGNQDGARQATRSLLCLFLGQGGQHASQAGKALQARLAGG